MAGEQILVVEDQRAVAGAMQMRLRGLGYTVMAIAKDGQEAIAKATELHPDLILMDIKLGEGMDGIDAARQIRSHLDIPVIYVSAYADQKLLERARQTHPAGFINKPFTTKDLLTTIDLALFQHERALGVPAHTAENDSEDACKEAIVIADVETQINFISQSAEQLLGWKRKRIVGRPLTEILSDIYELDHSSAAAIVDRVITLGSEERLIRNKDAPGTGEIDLLMPLRDLQGQIFGTALKFSSPLGSASGSSQIKAFAAAIDVLPIGIAIVREDRTTLHINAYAQEMLKHNHGLDYANNRLSARDRQFDEKLQQLVSTAIAKAHAGIKDGSGAMFIKMPTIHKQVAIIATPIAPGKCFGEGSCVILYLFDANLDRRVSHDILTCLYGLIQIEVEIVQRLVNGSTLDAAAKDLAISVNSARAHLKHIFHKTGINCQTELVHRIETGPAGLIINFNNGH